MALLKRMATVSGWTFGSRILGLVRDRLLAGAFSGSLALDAFLLAFALPNLFRNLFGEGALSAAFLPRYVQQRDQDPAAADAFAGLVLTRLAALLGVIAALGMIVAALLAWQGASEVALVAALALPQLPYLLFICVSAIMAGVLNGRGHFAVPAAAPVLLNIFMIVAISWWQDIWILPYAVLVIGVCQLALHLVALGMTGGVPKVRWRATPALKDLRKALLPVLFATGVFQLNALLDSIIAFVLVPGAGAVAYLFFANRLFQFPLGLIGHGVGTAVYPELSSAAGAGWTAAVHAVRNAGLIIIGLTLPACVGLVVVAEPLAGALYQHNAFDDQALARTVLATQMFALGLVPIALSKILIRVCHASRDQKTPLRVGMVMVALNLCLNLILVVTPLREAGLALASSISSWLTCGVYVVILTQRAGVMPLALRDAVVPLVASITMGGTILGLLAWWPVASGSGWRVHVPRLAVAVVAGMAIYAVLAGPSLRRAWQRAKA